MHDMAIYFQNEAARAYKNANDYRYKPERNILDDRLINIWMERQYYCSKVVRMLLNID